MIDSKETTMTNTLDLDTITLDTGAHDPPDNGVVNACVMEVVAYVAGEKWSDHPECASPVLGAFLRSWNDSLDDERRQELKQYVPRLVGSRGTAEQEDERSWMALDWLVRVHAPAWLRLAGLTEQADRLAGLGEFRAGMNVPSVKPTLDAVRKDAVAAWAAARDAARAAARAAAGDAARDAAGDAAWAAAWDAAGAASWDAAGDAAGAAAWDAAGAAARAAAGAAARDALAPTRDQLIEDAHRLVGRMLAVTDS